MRRFAQVDVFGDDSGFGNPVAVVIDTDALDDERLQSFANWTNLSETTFLSPPTLSGADYQARIFTTSRELPFAGHPTLGSAHAWLEVAGSGLDEVVQECGAGLVRVRRIDGRLMFAAPALVRSGPLDDAKLADIAETLGVARTEILDHAWTDNGPGWATVLLSSAARVLELNPDRADVGLDIGVVGLHPDGTPELRAFPSDAGIREDPVTGSLNAGVAEWLLNAGTLTAPYTARQGTALGRSGRVHIHRDADATIWVGGQTQTVVSGTVLI